MKYAIIIARSVLGLIYLVFGLDFFLHFISHIVSFPPLDDKANAFLGELDAAKYFFPFLKSVEIICGLFLLLNRYTLFFILAAFPITINIFLFHVFLANPVAWLGTILLVCNLFLIVVYRKHYISLFAASPVN